MKNQISRIASHVYVGNEIKKELPKDISFSAMCHSVYFANEDGLRRAFHVLYEDGNKCSGFREDKEGQSDFACDIDFVDKSGVSWYFCVRRDWNDPNVNSPSIPKNS